MAAVGDRVEVKSKSGPRTGVVTGVRGSLITLRWDNDEETTFVPAPGVLSVVSSRTTRPRRVPATTTKRAAVKKQSGDMKPRKVTRSPDSQLSTKSKGKKAKHKRGKAKQ